MSVSVFSLQVLGGLWSNTDMCSAHSEFVSQLRNLKNPGQELKSFTMACLQTCLTLCQSGILSLLFWAVNTSCHRPQRETASLPSKTVCSAASLKASPGKRLLMPLLKICTEVRETHGKLSPNTHICSKLQVLIYNCSAFYLYNSME